MNYKVTNITLLITLLKLNLITSLNTQSQLYDAYVIKTVHTLTINKLFFSI